MSLVSKQDILKPEGQKFGIGDLVRVAKGEDDFYKKEGLYRVLGSYYQLHGVDGESEVDEDDYDNPEELADALGQEQDEWQQEKEEYSLCCVEDRKSAWAWCDESCMEAVPEDALHSNILPTLLALFVQGEKKC
jgi:hypothetical protein